MTGEHKTFERYMHTEVVYRTASGEEVGREELHDAHWYDTLSTENVTEEELDDWFS